MWKMELFSEETHFFPYISNLTYSIVTPQVGSYLDREHPKASRMCISNEPQALASSHVPMGNLERKCTKTAQIKHHTDNNNMTISIVKHTGSIYYQERQGRGKSISVTNLTQNLYIKEKKIYLKTNNFIGLTS